MNHLEEMQKAGVAAMQANALARFESRVEDMEFLISFGVPHEEAALRAGWPTIHAAERALYRRGRIDLARPLAAAVWQSRRYGA